MNSYRYILRYYIDPDFHEDERIRELVLFCQSSSVEEVMLFYNPEERYAGFEPEAEVRAWIALACNVKAALAEAGIAMSLNPWATVVHVARGRHLTGKACRYRTMVGETGAVSPISCCPLDENWQTDLIDLFVRFAREIAPVAIWVEDDWRLHNHEPEMGFGGCFCAEHIRRMGEAVGHPTDREEILARILRENDPVWRQKFLDLSRDTLAFPAEALARAIAAAAPEVRIGLMCSTPDIHSAEGRDWRRLKRAFSPEAPLLLRPHLPPYTEGNTFMAFPTVTRQTIAEFSSDDIEVYPELENSPRSGAYSKSALYSRFECLESALYGAGGITINHFDMLGNGIALDRRFGRMLQESKPRLNALKALGCREENQQGVQVLFAPEVSRFVDSSSPDSLFGIVNNSVAWSRVLGVLGISHRLTRECAAGGIVAVSDRTLAAYSEADILTLLAGRLLLDGSAAAWLVGHGYGEYIGIAAAERRTQSQDGFAYEEIAESDPAVYGLAAPRMSAQRSATALWAFSDGTGAQERSTLLRYDRTRLYPGCLEYANRLGGMAISFAYPWETGQFYMGFFNVFRREFLQHMIGALLREGDRIAMGLELPLGVYRAQVATGEVIALSNPLRDPAETVAFRANAFHGGEAERLTPEGDWVPAGLKQEAPDVWRSMDVLDSMDILVLRSPAHP